MHFRNSHVIKDVVIVGAGGTGARLVPQVVQFLKTVPLFEQLEYPKVYLVDDDEVETKNLTRQLFVKPDVGKNKASVIASRYEKAYNYPIIDLPLKFQDIPDAYERNHSKHDALQRAYSKQQVIDNRTTDQDTKLDFFRGNKYTVFILCVDSVDARFKIFDLIRRNKFHEKYAIIDAGNENTFGQVSLFNLTGFGVEDTSEDAEYQIKLFNQGLKTAIPEAYNAVKDIETNIIPFPWHLYSDSIESEVNCAELDQTLAMNSLMASGIMAVFQNLVLMKPIPVVTTYYNLNGIHTHEPLNFSSFCGAPSSAVENLLDSGLKDIDTMLRQPSPGFSEISKLGSQENALFSLFNLFPDTSRRIRDRIDYQLKHLMILMEAKYYEYYLENGVGFQYDNLDSAYFIDRLNDVDLIKVFDHEGKYCTFNLTLDLSHISRLANIDIDQVRNSINRVIGDHIINVSFHIKTVDYLNLLASYFIATGQTSYGAHTVSLISAGILRGLAIPIMTPRICGDAGYPATAVTTSENGLAVFDYRYERIYRPFRGHMSSGPVLNKEYLKWLNHFFGYLDKFITTRYGDYRNFFKTGTAYTTEFLRINDDDETTPVDFTINQGDERLVEDYIFQAMKTLFSRLQTETSQEIFNQLEGSESEREADTVF